MGASRQRRRNLGTVAMGIILAAACGGEQAPEAEGIPYIPPTTPVRDTLSQASLEGIDPAEMGLTLPWTTGELNRQPEPGTPSRTIAGVDLSTSEGFDRFMIEFADDASQYPGYNLSYVEQVEDCAADPEEVSYDTRGSAFLLLRLSGARGHDEQSRSTTGARVRQGDSEHLHQVLATCDFEGQVWWAFDLGTQTPYRVIELNDPARLVVDVQHP